MRLENAVKLLEEQYIKAPKDRQNINIPIPNLYKWLRELKDIRGKMKDGIIEDNTHSAIYGW